ncbi:MAG: hypothetical protein ACRDOM_00165 [Nocardioides sp.]
MSSRSEDEAWRSIVENYGDQPDVEPLAPEDEREPSEPSYDEGDERDRDPWDAFDRFVPPAPPPVPHPPPVRLTAWIGLFGSPAVLLLALVLGIALPTWLGYFLVGYFVGGFLYLVFTMRREPRDPWDNGARV